MTQQAKGRVNSLLGGRFEIERVVGEGGMGTVYAARNTKTGASVAVKVIHEHAAGKPESIRRFFREAKAATAIEHPNVVRVLDAFVAEDGAPIMVMELLQGETLASFRKSRGKLELHEAASIMLPVVAALRAAHARGIVHRDMKPDNVFLSRSGDGRIVPKILDFGLAKARDADVLRTESGHTKTGTLMGTPAYMSLEQAMGDADLDQRADVWSIGVIVFELLVGRRPFEVETIGQMYRQLLTGSVPSIRDEVAGIPDDVATAVDRCLAKEKDARVESLDELQAVLARYADRELSNEQVAPKKRSRWPIVAGISLASLATLAVLLATMERSSSTAEPQPTEIPVATESAAPRATPTAVVATPPSASGSSPTLQKTNTAVHTKGGKRAPLAASSAEPSGTSSSQPKGGLISVDNPHAPRAP